MQKLVTQYSVINTLYVLYVTSRFVNKSTTEKNKDGLFANVSYFNWFNHILHVTAGC